MFVILFGIVILEFLLFTGLFIGGFIVLSNKSSDAISFDTSMSIQEVVSINGEPDAKDAQNGKYIYYRGPYVVVVEIDPEGEITSIRFDSR